MDLKVVSLDDYPLILGKEFLLLDKVVEVTHASRLVFLSNTRAWSMPMKQRGKLGEKRYISEGSISDNSFSRDTTYIVMFCVHAIGIPE